MPSGPVAPAAPSAPRSFESPLRPRTAGPACGSVVATLCAPAHNVASNATLYARGPYAGVVTYMKLTVETMYVDTRTVDDNYAYSVYTNRPTGRHNYHAIMFNSGGNKIVDGRAYDYN